MLYVGVPFGEPTGGGTATMLARVVIPTPEDGLPWIGDDPAEFLALVEELRGTEASAYTQMETPIFTCIRTDATQLLRLLG